MNGLLFFLTVAWTRRDALERLFIEEGSSDDEEVEGEAQDAADGESTSAGARSTSSISTEDGWDDYTESERGDGGQDRVEPPTNGTERIDEDATYDCDGRRRR